MSAGLPGVTRWNYVFNSDGNFESSRCLVVELCFLQ